MDKRKIIKNSLGYDSNLYVYQDKDMFNYSVDTILLGNFVSINRKTQKFLEIGTNNGALAIFIAERNKKIVIDALEIQEKALELAKKNIQLNNKEAQINLILGDFNDFYKEHAKQQLKKYDVIVCNPPFYKVDATIEPKNSSYERLVATHEIKLNLEQIIVGSSKIIEQKGYLTLVLPTERLVDCLILMRTNKFEPKRVQMIFPRVDKKSNLVLVEARYNAGWGTKFENNIYLHPNSKDLHVYNDEVIELYKPKK